jgi:alkylation response protein AidB-like acyl-CoA dehydrogenase
VFGALGAARECPETAIAYAGQREIVDRLVGSYQLAQAKLADMTLELGMGTLLALHLRRFRAQAQIALSLARKGSAKFVAGVRWIEDAGLPRVAGAIGFVVCQVTQFVERGDTWSSSAR